MSITTELREAINELRVECEEKEDCRVLWYPEPSRDRFSAIADRIDAALVERYVELPKDADGEAIRIGDVAYDRNESPSEKFSVATMELCKWGWALIDDYGERNEPGQCRHYHEPTVEDVLREFVERWHDTHHDDIPALFAEYAAKLSLAGEAE